MKTSFAMAILVLEFQLALRIIGEPFDFYTKIFLYILIDVSILMILFFEWFNFEAEWRIWLKETCGEPKK